MFSEFKNFEEVLTQETPEAKQNRIMFEYKKKQELKRFITKVNKQIIYDLLPIKKDYIICLKSCYNKSALNFTKNDILKLDDCKNDCKSLKKDLNVFLDNIAFLSQKKTLSCVKKCHKFLEATEDLFNNNVGYNKCLWMCHAKLDNRYKGYWLRQRNQIIERHKNKKYEQFLSDIENYS